MRRPRVQIPEVALTGGSLENTVITNSAGETDLVCETDSGYL